MRTPSLCSLLATAPQDLDSLQQCVCRDAGAQIKAGRLALWRAESLGCDVEALGEPWICDIEAPRRLWICNIEARGGPWICNLEAFGAELGTHAKESDEKTKHAVLIARGKNAIAKKPARLYFLLPFFQHAPLCPSYHTVGRSSQADCL